MNVFSLLSSLGMVATGIALVFIPSTRKRGDPSVEVERLPSPARKKKDAVVVAAGWVIVASGASTFAIHVFSH